jgi:superfamily I DNA/RNA helicase
MRLEKSALTFDDFIPLAIDILETNPNAHHRWCGPVQHLIVDEYQDVNRGQQRLLELPAYGSLNHA